MSIDEQIKEAQEEIAKTVNESKQEIDKIESAKEKLPHNENDIIFEYGVDHKSDEHYDAQLDNIVEIDTQLEESFLE